VDPVPDQLLLRKSGSAGNRTRDLRICSRKLWSLDHRDGLWKHNRIKYIRHVVNTKLLASGPCIEQWPEWGQIYDGNRHISNRDTCIVSQYQFNARPQYCQTRSQWTTCTHVAMTTAVSNDNNMDAVTVVSENGGYMRTHLRLDTRLKSVVKNTIKRQVSHIG
jgi:hypothetical protein